MSSQFYPLIIGIRNTAGHGYVQCFARVALGESALAGEDTNDFKFTTLKHDYRSAQIAPKWMDEEQVSLRKLDCSRKLFCTLDP